MCIIIHKGKGKKLTEEIYRECFRVNDDGVGIAYVDPDKKELVVEKGFMTFNDAYDVIKKHEDLEMLIHFRRVSRGPRDKDNCHPFLIEWEAKDGKRPRYSFAFAHNGTFDLKCSPGKSDTHTFVDVILKPWLSLDPWLLDHSFKRFIMEQYCTWKNKFVLMRYDNRTGKTDTFIVNEKQGNTAHGCWFSNYSWEPPKHDANTSLYAAAWAKWKKHPIGSQDTNPNFTNPTKAESFGEYYPDHLGWIWRESKKYFENINTHAICDKLSYRSPMQQMYMHCGTQYNRQDNKPEQIRGVVVSQTIIPGVLPVGQDKPLLTAGDAAELNKPGDSTPASNPNDATIVVPRDDDVIETDDTNEEDDWEKDFNRSSAIKTGDLRHLSKKDRREFKRMAMDYVKTSFGVDVNKKSEKCTIIDAIAILRLDYRETFPATKLLSIKELDKLILSSNGIQVEPTVSDPIVTNGVGTATDEDEVDRLYRSAYGAS